MLGNDTRSAIGRRVLPAVSLCLMLAACQQAGRLGNQSGSDIPVLRRPMWWGFYERGLAYARRGDWGIALEQYQIAVGERRGAIYPRPDDQRRARTYGLHFIDDYFPHREMGVAYFYRGDLPAAERELLLSEKMLPSARAKAYLNKVRARRLQPAPGGAGVPLAAPTLVVRGLRDGAWLQTPSVALTGEARSASRIASIRVNDQPLWVELAEPTVEFHARCHLKPGLQTVTVTAIDLVGHEATWKARVHMDAEAPAVATAVADDPAEVRVRVFDDQCLTAFSVNDMPIQLAPGSREAEARVPVTRDSRLNVSVTDGAGNRTELSESGRDLLRMSAAHRQYHRDTRLASLDVAGVFAEHPRDRQPPRLQLLPPVDGPIVVTASVYLLDMLLQDNGGIRDYEITVNGQGVGQGTMPGKVTLARCARYLELAPGPNTVDVTIADALGNRQRRHLTITRRLDNRWHEALRMTATLVAPDLTQTPKVNANRLRQAILKRLLASPRRLRLVQRDPRVLEQLRRELGIARGLAADPDRAPSERRRLLPAEWMLSPYATPWPGNDDWDLVLNAVDVATGEIVVTVDVHGEGFDSSTVEYGALGLASKLRQVLPALAAPVTAAGRQGVDVQLGRHARIRPGMRFVFVSRQAKKPEFADPIAWRGERVEGIVREVGGDTCRLALEPAGAAKQLLPHDLAILR